ncbi:MAG: EamA family transporter [Patescibacteria group bacterium]
MISSWLLYSLSAAAFWGFTNVIDQIVQRNYAKDSVSFTLVSSFVRLPIGLGLFFLFGFYVPSMPVLLMTFFFSFLSMAGVFFYLRALHIEEVSRVMLLGQSMPVFVLFLSFLFLGETLTLSQILGFLVLLFAGFLSVAKFSVSGKFFSDATIWAISAVLMWAISNTLLAYIMRSVPSGQMLLPWSYIGSSLSAVVVCFFPTVRKEFSWKSFSWLRNRHGFWLFMLSVLPTVPGFYFFFRAFAVGKASLITVALGVQPFFVSFFLFLLGFFFVSVPREDYAFRPMMIKMSAFVLSIVGLWMIQ